MRGRADAKHLTAETSQGLVEVGRIARDHGVRGRIDGDVRHSGVCHHLAAADDVGTEVAVEHRGRTGASDHSAGVAGRHAPATAADVVCSILTCGVPAALTDRTAASERLKLGAHDQTPWNDHVVDGLDRVWIGVWAQSVSSRATRTHRGEEGALRCPPTLSSSRSYSYGLGLLLSALITGVT